MIVGQGLTVERMVELARVSRVSFLPFQGASQANPIVFSSTDRVLARDNHERRDGYAPAPDCHNSVA